MKLSERQKTKALELAAIISGARGIMESPELEAQTCLQAIRLIQALNWVSDLIEEDDSGLLQHSPKKANQRLYDIITERGMYGSAPQPVSETTEGKGEGEESGKAGE